MKGNEMRLLDQNYNAELIKQIESRWSGKVEVTNNRGMVVATTSRNELLPFMTYLKNEHNFNVLMDLTSVDYLGQRDVRFEMVYMLFASGNMQRIRIKLPCNEGEKVPSLTAIWKGANWPEREVYDLMGIEFENHPLMERIIMPEGYIGHPLRRDFPLKGRGEDYLIDSILLPVKNEIENDTGKQG